MSRTLPRIGGFLVLREAAFAGVMHLLRLQHALDGTPLDWSPSVAVGSDAVPGTGNEPWRAWPAEWNSAGRSRERRQPELKVQAEGG